MKIQLGLAVSVFLCFFVCSTAFTGDTAETFSQSSDKPTFVIASDPYGFLFLDVTTGEIWSYNQVGKRGVGEGRPKLIGVLRAKEELKQGDFVLSVQGWGDNVTNGVLVFDKRSRKIWSVGRGGTTYRGKIERFGQPLVR